MKKITFISILFFAVLGSLFAQGPKKAQNVQLSDVNNSKQYIPGLGSKVIVVFYVDPDVHEIADPLSDAINSARFPKEKFGAMGVVNCKDTWMPDRIIYSLAKDKQEKYPESLLLLDKSHALQSAWGLGEVNDKAMVVLIGKDARVKWSRSFSTTEAVKKSIPEVLKLIKTTLSES